MVRGVFVSLFFVGCVLATVAIPPEWKAIEKVAHPSTEVRLIFSLSQENLGRLEQLFWERSDPRNPMYGQYLNRKEIADLVAPNAVSENAVREWLLSVGVKASQIEGIKTRDALYVYGSVKQFEDIFGVQYEYFQHVEVQEKQILRSRVPYALPAFIAPHIQLIHGIQDFPPLMRRNRQRTNSNTPLDFMQQVTRTTSNTPTVTIDSVNGRSQAPGSTVVVDVSYACPSGTSDCIEEVQVVVNSNNKNIHFHHVVGMNVAQCSNSRCNFMIPVEFYIPLNISAAGFDSNQKQVAPVVYWEYPVVVDPHVVPQTLWDLYQMTMNPLVTNPNATQSVVEFEQQYYSPTDLKEFFVLMGLPSAPVTVVGPNNITNPGGEANLDIQWIMAMAPGASTYFWSVAADSPIEIDHILTWCYQMEDYDNPPLVNSLSYGMTEGNVDKYLGSGYLNRTNTELQKLALQGLTIIIADGDTGANDIGPPPMSQLDCYPSHPDWPSDSSYVTSIGSTFITPLSERICYVENGADCLSNPVGEVTVSVDMGMTWTTGGGFSNVTPRPAYQNDIVNAYLRNTSQVVPPASYFDQAGRAYADAVTVGHNLECILSSSIVAIDGTSASAPIFAGMVTVLNDARMNMGKSPLGFITPLMYQTFTEVPSCWNDITVGHNKCGAYGWKPVCCDTGYTATTGWDPVSGVGSPNISALKQYVLSLP